MELSINRGLQGTACFNEGETGVHKYITADGISMKVDIQEHVADGAARIEISSDVEFPQTVYLNPGENATTKGVLLEHRGN